MLKILSDSEWVSRRNKKRPFKTQQQLNHMVAEQNQSQ